MVLLLIDRTPFMRDLAQVSPFNLMLKTGVANTAHGPLMFLLFYVPDPKDPAPPPVTMMDAHANPFDPVHIAMWRDLSRQSHWHLFLVGPDNEQAGFFEFANVFGLGEVLDLAAKACAGKKHGDFNAAKAEFCGRYSLDDLFGM